MEYLRNYFANFFKDCRGAAVVETAMILPVFMLMVLGGTEITRYVMLNMRLDRAAMTVADLTSQADSMSVSKMNAIFDAVAPIMNPFTLGNHGTLIVTSITRTGGTTTINWRQSFGGSGASSQVASSPVALNDGETVIVGEAFYQFTPYFAPSQFTAGITNRSLRKVALYRTRMASLTTISNN